MSIQNKIKSCKVEERTFGTPCKELCIVWTEPLNQRKRFDFDCKTRVSFFLFWSKIHLTSPLGQYRAPTNCHNTGRGVGDWAGRGGEKQTKSDCCGCCGVRR